MHSSWKSKGGVLGFFWQILLRGVLGVVRKLGGVVFYCIFMWKFFKNLYRGNIRCTPPVCIYAFALLHFSGHITQKDKVLLFYALLLNQAIRLKKLDLFTSELSAHPTHLRKIKGQKTTTQTVPKTCQALRRLKIRQRKKLSSLSEKQPTKMVEMLSEIWPDKRTNPAYVLSNFRT